MKKAIKEVAMTIGIITELTNMQLQKKNHPVFVKTILNFYCKKK